MQQLITCFLVFVLLISCSDNNTDNNETKNANEFFPMQIGNYWIYEFVELDTLYQPTENQLIDSTIITGKMDMNGVTLYEFSTYRNDEIILTEHWATDSRHIWQLRGAREDSIPGIQDTLFSLVKFNAMDWNVFFFHSDSIDYTWDGINGWADYIFNANSRINITKEDVYNYKNYESRSYKFTADKIFGFTSKKDSSVFLISNFGVTYYTLAKGIGLTEIEKLPSYYYINNESKLWVNGYRKRLIRHNII